jgi:hypothetical protein
MTGNEPTMISRNISFVGETNRLRFWLARARVIGASAPVLAAKQGPDLTANNIKQDKYGRVNFQGGAPTPSEPLSAFLQRNIQNGSGFLSGTQADAYTEFSKTLLLSARQKAFQLLWSKQRFKGLPCSLSAPNHQPVNSAG